MKRPLVLALDQGSSSSRVLAFDSAGRVVAQARKTVKTHQPKAGWFEHDAVELATSLEASLDSVLASLPKNAEIVGAGLACQRSTVVFWDKTTGKPAARAPSWQDGRAAEIAAARAQEQGRAHERTGLYLTPYYSAPKIRWFLENVPAVRKLADEGKLLMGPVSTWLIWRLTKGAVFAADPTTAQRMMLMDLRRLDWDDGLLSLFGVPRHCLPEIRPSAGDWGVVTRKGRTVRLLAALGDQQAAALGLGASATGASVANYGTGAFFLHNAGSEPRPIPGLLSSVGWNGEGAAPIYLQEGTIHAAGTSFDWLRDNLKLFKDSSRIDALCRASKRRVWALPAIGGLGAPRWDYKTKTTFFGLDTKTAPEDLVRGVAEGIAFLMGDIVAALRAGGISPQGAMVAGGLSRIPFLMQFQADLLGFPLSRCDGGEATALGAAFLAARRAGAVWADKLSTPRVDKVFRPSRDLSALHAQWREFVDAQAALSRKLA